MAILSKRKLVENYSQRQKILLDDENERKFAARSLSLDAAAARLSLDARYDIFLSHCFDDARVIRELKDRLTASGYSVYVDWIEDDHLQRGRVTEHTASVLRQRMDSSASLIYVTSDSAEQSVWMPWELGYMDARTGRVAVAPILDEDADFEGREYLGLYPYLDLTYERFYLHSNPIVWVNLDDWMRGGNPRRRG